MAWVASQGIRVVIGADWVVIGGGAPVVPAGAALPPSRRQLAVIDGITVLTSLEAVTRLTIEADRTTRTIEPGADRLEIEAQVTTYDIEPEGPK